MILYPAIDLMDGRSVRLRQGRFDAATVYPLGPGEALALFADAGASWAHIVDLDGARHGEPRQHAFIASLARDARLALQVAGGFRNRDQVARMLDAGVERVVIGTMAVHEPSLVEALLEEFGFERIALALDVRLLDGTPVVATQGWQVNSGRSFADVARLFPQAVHMLVTDIGRDGMMAGPNLALLSQVAEAFPRLRLQASGGIASLKDVDALRSVAAGAILGRALWDRAFALEEALTRAGV
jgi:phosphoribosylformimino-5-aminoimidazole carboxamide ribotide isomerase